MLLKGTPVGEVTEEDLNQLIQDGVVEDRKLEYKRELELDTNSDKKKFLRDATAMANASGGVIIFGMEENDGQAESLDPVDEADVDGEILRMENLLRTSVDPRIHGYQVAAVDGGGGKIILLGLPRSLNAPHQVKKGDDRFYIRTSNGKHRMDVGELRQVVDLSSAAEERVRHFRDDRIGKILSGNVPVPLEKDTPLLVVHLVPLNIGVQAQTFSIDESFRRRHATNLRPLTRSVSNNRYNIDGLLTYQPHEGRCKTYLQFFRRGMIESVGTTGSGNQSVPLSGAIDRVVSKLGDYLEVQNGLGVNLPVVALLSLLRAKGWRIMTQNSPHAFRADPFDRDSIQAPEIVFQSFDTDTSHLRQKMEPAINALWNAGGFPGSPQY